MQVTSGDFFFLLGHTGLLSQSIFEPKFKDFGQKCAGMVHNIHTHLLNSLTEERSINNLRVICHCSQGLIANLIQVYLVSIFLFNRDHPCILLCYVE
jgi:hypothetical protein